VLERPVAFVAGGAFVLVSIAKNDRMLEIAVDDLYGIICHGLGERRVADVAFVAYDAAVIACVQPVVASEAALSGQMANVVRMCLPVRFHLREEIGLIYPLHLGYCVGEALRIV